MDAERFVAALQAWRLAIEEKVSLGKSMDRTSFRELAIQYGKKITTVKDLDEVAECFNWEVIERYVSKD